MRFRTGLLIGLAAGYYFGAKAGRERFHEIEAWLDTLRTTATYQDTRTKLSDGLRELSTLASHIMEDTASGGADSDRSAPATPPLRTTFSDPTFN